MKLGGGGCTGVGIRRVCHTCDAIYGVAAGFWFWRERRLRFWIDGMIRGGKGLGFDGYSMCEGV